MRPVYGKITGNGPWHLVNPDNTTTTLCGQGHGARLHAHPDVTRAEAQSRLCRRCMLIEQPDTLEPQPRKLHPLLTPPVVEKLQGLQEQARTVRGGVHLDDPRRRAGLTLSSVLADLVAGGVPKAHLDRVLGIGNGCTYARLVRYGHLPPRRSIRPYGHTTTHHARTRNH